MIAKHVLSIPAVALTFQRWKTAWTIAYFRWPLLVAIGILCVLGLVMADYFAFIQDRPGIKLNDPFLVWLPSVDLSIPILFCIYIPLLYLLFQSITDPYVFWKFVTGFVVIHLLRIISLLLFPLETPDGFIPLYDPVQGLFYGGRMISKDLFFSGHTAMVFWIFFSVRHGMVRRMMLLTNITLMAMLLFQHIHYAVDIVVALLVTIVLDRLSNQVRFHPPD